MSNLKNIIVEDEIPTTAPLVQFVAMPKEGGLNNNIFVSTGMSAQNDLSKMLKLEEKINQLKELSYDFYSRRSISKPFRKYLQTIQNNDTKEKIVKMALDHIRPVNEFLFKASKTFTESIQLLKGLFGESESWNKGLYCDDLLFSICKLIFQLNIFNFLKQEKSSLQNEIETAKHFCSIIHTKIDTYFHSDSITFLTDDEFMDKCLAENFKPIPFELMKHISSIFYQYLVNQLTTPTSTTFLPEDNYARRFALAFFIKYFPASIPSGDPTKLMSIFQSVPFIPLICEYSFNIFEYVRQFPYFKNVTVTPAKVEFTFEEVERKKNQFADVAYKLWQVCSKANSLTVDSNEAKIPNSEIIQIISEAITLISQTTNLLREIYAQKIANPPKVSFSMTTYETTVRYGYGINEYGIDEMLEMLHLLALCRQLHDVMRSNAPILKERILTSIHSLFQEFIKHDLKSVVKSSKRDKTAVKEIMEKIRLIAGRWGPNESPEIDNTEKDKKDSKRHHTRTSFKASEVFVSIDNTIKPSLYAIFTQLKPQQKVPASSKDISIESPSGELIEFVRIQIFHLLNPENELMKSTGKLLKKGSAYGEKGEKKLCDFLKNSSNWVSLLDFEDTLREIGDQSCFYFKEVELDRNNKVQFSVRSSLPFILCQFALDNCSTYPEVTEILFYPLSIYNDAAYASIHRFHSQMLFNEIEAEANVALSTLAALIGEQAFDAHFALSMYDTLPNQVIVEMQKRGETIKRNSTTDSDISHKSQFRRKTLSSDKTNNYLFMTQNLNNRVNHIQALLKQNSFCLLSKLIDLKSVITPSVEKEFIIGVTNCFMIPNDIGLHGSIALEWSLKIAQKAHTLLINQGIPLMPFNYIVENAKSSTKYYQSFAYHLTEVFLRKNVLTVLPIRFFPPKSSKNQLSAELLGKLVFGKALKDLLDNTVTVVQVRHVSALFKTLNYEALTYIVTSVLGEIENSFQYMMHFYYEAKQRLIRIQDAPFGTSSIEAFEIYSEAYKIFMTDRDVVTLFRAMQNLGNILALCELFDQTLSMKEFNLLKLESFLRDVSEENGMASDRIFKQFDEAFQTEIKHLSSWSLNAQRKHDGAIFATAIQIIVKLLNDPECRNLLNDKPTADSEDAFEDNSNFVTKNKHTFASIWSVLEFIFCLMECVRKTGNESDGFMKYGHGVTLIAGLILKVLDQKQLAESLSIGNVLFRHKITDFSQTNDNILSKYLAVSNYEQSVLNWAYVYFDPFTKNQ